MQHAKMIYTRACATIVMLLLGSAGALAALMQTSQPGKLRGQVADRTGAVLPGGTVVLRVGNRDVTYTTSEDGAFSFDDVPAGEYALEVSHPGFKTFRTTVTIRSNQTTSISVILDHRPMECRSGLRVDYKTRSTGDPPIGGTIYSDAKEKRAAVEGVEFVLRGVDSESFRRTALSNKAGAFVFENLEPGRYRLIAGLADHAPIPTTTIYVTKEKKAVVEIIAIPGCID